MNPKSVIQIYIPLPIEMARRDTFPLLKRYFGRGGVIKVPKVSHEIDQRIQFCETLFEADLVILPMSWNYYYQQKLEKKLLSIIEDAAKQKAQVWSFTSGDYGVNIPYFSNLTVFRASGTKSKLPPTHIGLPSFIEDPVNFYFSDTWEFKQYSKKPLVGFCGMANRSKLYAIEELTRISIRNLSYFMGISKELPQSFIPSTLRRAQLLMNLEKDAEINTHFIYRKKYRAGSVTKEERYQSTLEFFQNIHNSQYILCFRGAGNFSVRFYETLAMGRIPIVVDTNGFFPLENAINWKKHAVWVPYNKRNKLADFIVQFHQKHTPDSFVRFQESNRTLWEEKLTLEGFFNSLFNAN